MGRKNKAPGNAESSTGKFRPGPAGTCEAFLFEFSNERGHLTDGHLDAEKTLATTHRIAAGSMLEAIAYMAQYEPDFHIWSVQKMGAIVLLSGSRYN